MDHAWLGNIRELRQTILRIAIFEDRLDEILHELEAARPAADLPATPPPRCTAAGGRSSNGQRVAAGFGTGTFMTTESPAVILARVQLITTRAAS